jgi:hypothetical protein
MDNLGVSKLATTLRTLWFVFKLSTCFLNTACQKSLQMNLITSSVSPMRGLSRLYLRFSACRTKTAQR